MADTECTRCGRVVCHCQTHTMEWIGGVIVCERCYPDALIEEELNAQEAANEAEAEIRRNHASASH